MCRLARQRVLLTTALMAVRFLGGRRDLSVFLPARVGRRNKGLFEKEMNGWKPRDADARADSAFSAERAESAVVDAFRHVLGMAEVDPNVPLAAPCPVVTSCN